MKKIILLLLSFTALNLFSQEILIKDLGIDEETGSNVQVKVWKVIIDAKTEIVQVEYDIEYLSPKGVVLKVIPSGYTRFNQPAVLDADGNIVTPAKMNFEMLRNSAIGKGIAGMITETFKNYPNLAQ